jgi:hypothetical protein
MDAKKVDVEVVNDTRGSSINENGFLKRAKVTVAIVLDMVDLFVGWIPIVNTAWDVVTFLALRAILRNKKLAYASLIELPLLGLLPFSLVDMFIPMATLIVLIDNSTT